jgi:ABC-type Fe3+ transport system permease subunit
VIGLLMLGAIIGAVVQSVQPTAIAGGAASLAAWRSVLGDPAFAWAVQFTLETTLAATILAAVGGLLIAALLRGAGPAARLALALPVGVTHLTIAVSLAAWAGPGGIAERIGLPIDVVGDRRGVGIVLVYAVKEAPFVALAALAVWDDATQRREQAAAVLGAGPVRRLVSVSLPRLGGAIAAAAAAGAAYAIGAAEVPLIVGPAYPGTIATYALQAAQTPDPAGQARAAVALLIAAMLALTAAAAALLIMRRRRA